MAERNLLLVELAGPAGSGKSTLIDQVRKSNSGSFSYAGPPQPAIAHKIVAAMMSLPVLFFPVRLDLHSRRRMFQRSRAIISARMWLRALPNGLYLLDEGPFRIMRDYIFFSKSEERVWKKIARAEASKLDGDHVLVVDLKVDDRVRDERRRQRMSRLERQDPRFNPSLKVAKKKLQGRFLRDDWESVICDMQYPPLLRKIDSLDSPEIVMKNLLALIEREADSALPRVELG